MKNKETGFMGIALLILIALASVGASAYFYIHNKTAATSFDDVSVSKIQNQTIQASTTTTEPSSSGYTFNLKNTPDYAISFSVKDCDKTFCSGSGSVTVKDARSKNVIQVLNSNDLSFFKDSVDLTSTDDTVLYGEQSPVIIGDFNFDGAMDLALIDGHNGAYGSPSYDIYLFDPSKKQFVQSSSLTILASENLGMFFVDKNKKLLTVFSKDGCCWHQTDEYKVINNAPVLIHSVAEDATVDEGKVLVTDKTLTNGSWVTTTKEFDEKTYYSQ